MRPGKLHNTKQENLDFNFLIFQGIRPRRDRYIGRYTKKPEIHYRDAQIQKKLVHIYVDANRKWRQC